jgi:hypothetical protein
LLQNCPRVGRAPSKGYFGLDGGQWTLLEINTHTKLQFLNKAQSSHKGLFENGFPKGIFQEKRIKMMMISAI